MISTNNHFPGNVIHIRTSSNEFHLLVRFFPSINWRLRLLPKQFNAFRDLSISVETLTLTPPPTIASTRNHKFAPSSNSHRLQIRTVFKFAPSSNSHRLQIRSLFIVAYLRIGRHSLQLLQHHLKRLPILVRNHIAPIFLWNLGRTAKQVVHCVALT